MKEETRERLVDSSIWLRGLYMVFFAIAYNIAELIIALLAIFQFFAVLITGRVNEVFLQFGNNLSVYAFDILQFVTFNSEDRPFPFSPWPDEAPGGSEWSNESDVVEAEFEEVVDDKTDAADEGDGEDDESGESAQEESAPEKPDTDKPS